MSFFCLPVKTPKSLSISPASGRISFILKALAMIRAVWRHLSRGEVRIKSIFPPRTAAGAIDACLAPRCESRVFFRPFKVRFLLAVSSPCRVRYKYFFINRLDNYLFNISSFILNKQGEVYRGRQEIFAFALDFY